MDNSKEPLDRWREQRYSVTQLLLGTGVALWGALRLGPVVWVAGGIIAAGGLAKLIAPRFGASKRTFTALNVGPVLLLAGYFAVIAAVTGSWGLSILAVTVGGMAVAVLLQNNGGGETLHESIGVVGFGTFALTSAIAGDMVVAAVGLLFVGLNGKNLLERRRAGKS
ncbi:hypothetical protein [Halolamina sp.]|jgi:hypothetical protein|uniref:hypothetical protein n=1 Tax=Halolamina sp. TaxID=1940283 RepID=UPI000223BEFF|nr:hypothetical protein Halar_2706 [halophilic archaeon DL31]